MKKQSDFFNYGEKYLKPMRLKDVADEIGVHESTVSRSTNGKYIRTDRGTYELKEFFTNGLGSEVSSVTVKTHMREMIEGEDKKKPLSDSCIEKLLNKRGLTVSRRTIAKYREEMGIRSSNKRKIYE
ncbi:Sigma-54, DNA binding domain protein [Peptostreptococcaceae bacterium oral taxon 113 str. W5053]|nr:Sigma-54, DNA binding domain protein [Peptostreptococcaceae bacterium oral taxon 113 str. W5053]